MPTDVIMPQLGESVVEGTILRWHKRVGEAVDSMEALLEISTDKVDAEIPSPAAGVLLEILVPEGATVVKGTRLAVIGETGAQPAAAFPPHIPLPEGERPEVSATTASAPEMRAAPPARHTGPHVTPVVARMAAEHNLDLAQIRGSGREGRVTRKDIDAFLSARDAVPAPEPELPPWERPGSGDLFKPSSDYEVAQPVPPHQRASAAVRPALTSADGTLTPLSPMRRIIAERLTRTVQSVPLVSTVFEVDLSGVLAHRDAHKAEFAAQGVRLTLTAYFALASVAALQAVPALNSEWRADGIFTHRAAHLGLAVALDPGLIVPVIRHAEALNLLGMARAVNDAASRARAGQLTPAETQGSTFTITNHGGGGSLFAQPIINAPNAGILGVGLVEQRVKVITDAQGRESLAVRPCVYLSLTFDHRLADGAEGDAFLACAKATLEGWE